MSEVLSTYFLSCPPGERFDLRRQVLDGMGRLSLCYGQLGWEIVGKLWENCGNVSGDGCANLGHAATARGQGNVDVSRKSMPTKRADFPPQPQDDWADDCDADMM